MRIDLHVHTSKYSHCAKATPEEMIDAAVRAGLDGIVLTEHDHLWSQEELARLQNQTPLRLLRGIEVSTKQGHFLAYGIQHSDGLYKGMSVLELAKRVHERNGVLVMAHPCRYNDEIPQEIYNVELDGVEGLSGNVRMYMHAAIETISKRLHIPQIAGTDAHRPEMLGLYATEFTVPIETDQDLAAAIASHAFILHKNQTGVQAINATIDDDVFRCREILATRPELSGSDVKAIYGFNHSFQYGVRNNKNMRLL
jgi:predicted metal-dependent phosphoesterase TrpH